MTVPVRGPTDELERAWWTYKASADRDARDQLILHYSPIVKYVAARVVARLPSNVDESDLISYGMFGLIDALERFDPERKTKFESYAMDRIRGAIVDELRSLDWVPRNVRLRAKRLEHAYQRLEGTLNRSPSDRELAAELELSGGQLQQWLAEISVTGVAELDEMFSDSDGDGEPGRMVEWLADGGDAPGDLMEVEETRQWLRITLNDLPEREKMVLTLYYFEGLSLAEIADALGVTVSRISQVHTKAVLHLRSRMVVAGLVHDTDVDA